MSGFKNSDDLVERRYLLEEALLNTRPQLKEIEVATALEVYNYMIAAKNDYELKEKENHRKVVESLINNKRLKAYSPEFQKATKRLLDLKSKINTDSAGKILEDIILQIKNPASDPESYEYRESFKNYTDSNIIQTQKKPGIIFVLGFIPGKPEHDKYVNDGLNNKQLGYDIIGRNLLDTDDTLKKNIIQLFYKDGAIILDPKATIVRARAHLINLKGDKLAKHYGVRRLTSKIMGYHRNVDMRHESGTIASYQLKNNLIILLSEETGDVTLCRNAMIDWSTNRKENYEARKRLGLNVDMYKSYPLT